MEKTLTSKEEEKALKETLARRAGENTVGFKTLPTIKVYNANPNNPEDSEFEGGDLISSVKTESGYKNEKIKRPFTANIIKIRMFLKTKKKFTDNGVPFYITDEFDHYGDNGEIVVKERIEDGYKPVFKGNYKEVNSKYSIKGEYSQEKYLELHHIVYIVPNLDKEEMLRVVFKGTSRSKFFDYQNSFDRVNKEYMTSTWTTFDSVEVKKDWQGKPLRFSVYAFDFKKEKPLTFEELKKSAKFQEKLEKDLWERTKAFKKDENLSLPERKEEKEEIPTIQLDELSEQDSLEFEKAIDEGYKKAKEKEEEISIEDIPFA